MTQELSPAWVFAAPDEPATGRLGAALAGALQPGVVVALIGQLGAGKTRLVRAVAEAAGADRGAVGSPTFVLVHEYAARWPIYHFDAYRLRSGAEFAELGAAEYFDSEGVSFVEWADRVTDILPADHLRVEIITTGETSRTFRFTASGERSGAALRALREAMAAQAEVAAAPAPSGGWSDLWRLEDWWAVWLGGLILAVALGIVERRGEERLPSSLAAIVTLQRQLDEADGPDADAGQALLAERKQLVEGLAAPFRPLIAKPKDWDAQPLAAIYRAGAHNLLPALATVLIVCLALFGIGVTAMGGSLARFAAAFVPLFLLATLAYVLAGQRVIKWANLEYPLWGLLAGLLISNTAGTPDWLKPAVRTEFYIKTGLVLLGAEVLLSQLAALGLPGICISWIVTPIVLVATYVFGQRVLKMESKTLNLVISADMSVCGVSAAIATAAACRAKKEELSLAIGISLAFTVVMMIAMPPFIAWAGIDRVVGAAWIGGTIDATGAVAAAGEMLGKDVLPVAATVKMIQNVLIGAIAFAVAVYWVTFEERPAEGPALAGPAGGAPQKAPRPTVSRPSLWEIWRRFPKFIIGFVLASAAYSAVFAWAEGGEFLVRGATDGCTKTLREWFFCLAFVAIGLETNFRELARFLKGGKPLVLYVCGQALSLVLSLAMCWLMLKVVFPQAAAALTR